MFPPYYLIGVQESVTTASPANVEPSPIAHKNQIAILCGLISDHVTLLQKEPKMPMNSSAISAYLLFAASKLETAGIIVIKPQFFSAEINALSTLKEFIIGDVSAWEIVFIVVSVPKQNNNWSICVHQKDESTVFFDPAIKPGESHYSLGGQYKSNRKALLGRINTVLQKLYELSCTNAYTVSLYVHFRLILFNRLKETLEAIKIADTNMYNTKELNINEGLHVVLIAESYMANFSATKLEYFNLTEERTRVLDNLKRLCEDDDAIYIPRPIIPDKYIELSIPRDVFALSFCLT